MDWFNWSNDEEEISPKVAKYNEIESWIDNEFGSYNYFGIRSFVKSAMDNTLHVEYPQSPYNAKEVIEWAEYNDNDSFFFTAGGQAIEGETFSDTVFGAPDINPVTQKPNSQAVKDGVILGTIKSGASTMFKVGLTLGAIALLFSFSSAKARKLGVA